MVPRYVTGQRAAIPGASFSNALDGNRESLGMAWDTFRECYDCMKLTSLMSAQPDRTGTLTLAEQNFSTATDLADAIVRNYALWFRVGGLGPAT